MHDCRQESWKGSGRNWRELVGKRDLKGELEGRRGELEEECTGRCEGVGKEKGRVGKEKGRVEQFCARTS